MKKTSNMENYQTLADCKFGKHVKIINPVNVYGCEIGDDSFVGPFVEIQTGVKIGKNTTISSHSFICSGVEVGNDVFIAHGVMFTNDKFIDDNKERLTYISDGVKIGSGAVILPVKIGANAIIGAGAVVTKNVPAGAVAYGNPAIIKEGGAQ